MYSPLDTVDTIVSENKNNAPSIVNIYTIIIIMIFLFPGWVLVVDYGHGSTELQVRR